MTLLNELNVLRSLHPGIQDERVDEMFVDVYYQQLLTAMLELGALDPRHKPHIGAIINETTRKEALRCARLVREAGRPELADQLLAQVPECLR